METQDDLRIIKTRQNIRDAFFELAEQVGIDKITVQNLTKQAMINRSTFYLHYTDKYDLLYQLEEEILSGIKKTLMDVATNVSVGEFNSGSPYPYIVNFLEYVRRNERFFKIILSEKGDPTFAMRMAGAVKIIARRKILDHRTKRKFTLPQKYSDAIFISMLTSFIGVWIDGDISETAEDVAEMITNFETAVGGPQIVKLIAILACTD